MISKTTKLASTHFSTNYGTLKTLKNHTPFFSKFPPFFPKLFQSFPILIWKTLLPMFSKTTKLASKLILVYLKPQKTALHFFEIPTLISETFPIFSHFFLRNNLSNLQKKNTKLASTHFSTNFNLLETFKNCIPFFQNSHTFFRNFSNFFPFLS